MEKFLRRLLDKLKVLLFPDIKDWSASHDDKRFREDWWKLTWKELVFFHSGCTKWFLLGVNVIAALFLILGGIFMHVKYGWIWGAILYFFSLIFLKGTYNNLRSWKHKTTFNLYDLLFREGWI